MKKLTIQITALALMIGISACQKETNSVQVNEPKTISEQEALQKFGTIVQRDLTKIFEINNQKLTLTYNITDKEKVIINKHTEDNDKIFNYIKENKDFHVLCTGENSPTKLFENVSACDKYILEKVGTRNSNTNQLKATNNGITVKFWAHANYVGNTINTPMQFCVQYPWVLGNGQLGSIPYSQSKYFKTSDFNSWVVNGNYNAIENSWVNNGSCSNGGGNNDIMSSLKMNNGISTGVYSYYWNEYVLRIFEDVNFGGAKITFWQTHTTQLDIPYIGVYNISSFLFYNVSWNDAMSSYVAIAI